VSFRFRVRQAARQAVTLAVVFAFVLSFAAVAEACPSCKESLGSCDAASGGADLVAGYFYSILFMMSMPFALLGTFSSYMYWQVRRARDEQTTRTEQSADSGDKNHSA